MEKTYLSKTKIFQIFETLQGLIDGIAADQIIKPEEIKALQLWLETNSLLAFRPPFKEVIQVIKTSLADNHISDSELKDIKFACKKILLSVDKLTKNKTNSIQKLHGIASGIAVDGEIHPHEWSYLIKWIDSHQNLKGSWPFDEIEALTIKHAQSELLSKENTEMILHYLKDFCGFNNNTILTHPLNEPGLAITGICAVCPNIDIQNKTFCLTGSSEKYTRKELAKIITDLGGFFKDDVSKQVDYLIVCADGSPMWAYSCYGRKVEDAVNLRKSGHKILIVHEFDFLDFVRDAA